MTQQEMIPEVKRVHLRDRFPRGSFRGEVHDENGHYICDIHVPVKGEAHLVRVNDGIITHSAPRIFATGEFKKVGGCQLSARQRVNFWALKAMEF